MKKVKVLTSVFILLLFTMFFASCAKLKVGSIFGDLESNSNKVTVIFLVEGSAAVVPSQVVDPDTVIQLPSAEIENNFIVGWSEISPYDPVPMNVGADYTVEQTIVLYAVMDIDNAVMVIFDVAGDVGLVIPKYAPKNTSVKLPNAVVVNHTMKGWSETGPDDASPLLVGSSYLVTESITLYAVLEKKPPPYERVTTKFSVDGEIDESLTFEIDAGESFDLPYANPAQSDLMFAGWTVDEKGGGAIRPHGTKYVANKNGTLYAKFLQMVTVLFNVDGDLTVVQPMVVEPGTTITLPEAAVGGNKVIGWIDLSSEDSAVLECGSELFVTKNTTLTAMLERKAIITFDVRINGTDYNVGYENVPQIIVNKGEGTILPTLKTKVEGYTFLGWKTIFDYIEIPEGIEIMPAGSTIAVYNDTTLYAAFVLQRAVTFYDENFDSIEVVRVDAGSEITLPGYKKIYGYTFRGWKQSAEDTEVLPVGSYYTVNSDTAFYAHYEKQVTVVFDVHIGDADYNEDGEVIESMLVDARTEITLPDYNNRIYGYTFKGWKIDKDSPDVLIAGRDFTVNSDTTLYAHFEVQPTVTFDVHNNGTDYNESGSNVASMRVDSGSEITLPDFTVWVQYYTFKGWKQDPDDSDVLTAGSKIKIYSNTTFYAYFEVQPIAAFDVRHNGIDYNAGGSNIASIYEDAGKDITLPNFTIRVDKHTFIGWRQGEDGTAVLKTGNKVKIYNDTIFYAVFEVQPIVTFDVHIGDADYNVNGSNVASVQEDKGTKINLPALTTVPPTYRMAGWSETGANDSNPMSVGYLYTVSSNVTLYAVLIEQVTVTFNIGGNTGLISPVTVDINGAVTLPSAQTAQACMPPSYRFDGWSLSSVSPQAKVGSPLTVTENVTLYPIQILQVTVTYSVQGSTDIISAKTVDVGDKVKLPYLSVENYRMAGWSSVSVSDLNPMAIDYEYTVSSNVTMYAVLIEQVTVIYSVNSDTSLVKSFTCDINTVYYLPDATVANFDMLGWMTAFDDFSNIMSVGYRYTAASNITLYARLTKTQVTVYFSANDSNLPSLTKTVNINTNIILPNPVINGYILLGWTEDAGGTGKLWAVGSSYTLSASKTLYAKLQVIIENYTFNYLSENECELVGFEGDAVHLTIPSVYNGRSVVRISSAVFKGNTSIISVSLPSSVRTIGFEAFYGTSSLTTINLNNVVDIESSAFYGASKLQISSLNTINVLRSIGAYAFAYTSIQSADYADVFSLIPTLMSIGGSAFEGWTEDMTIDISAVNKAEVSYAPGWSGNQVYLQG